LQETYLPFYDLSKQPSKILFPGVTITPIWGDEIMMSFVQFEWAGATVPEHSHPHEQAGMGLEGEFELVIDGEARIIRQGDCYVIPGHVPHSARSVNGPARALDIFHPVREEYTVGLEV
jgi:quercetin dioxygenase-like cupin family protein